MKRIHVNLHVDNLSKSIGFYSKLLAAEPTRVETDYAKWMLDDPALNFAISTRGIEAGIDHLGIQTDDPAELGAYLECGILAHGFARAFCDACRHDFLIFFSCKGRGIYPSCTAKRMSFTAAHLVSAVIPPVPVRQWVLSVPKRLR